jgi:hypothetical protein
MARECSLGTTPRELVRRSLLRVPGKLAKPLLLCVFAFGAGRWTAPSNALATAPADPVDAMLAQLEVELAQGMALVANQQELRRRREAVTQVACASASEHWADMDRLARRSSRRMAEWLASRPRRHAGAASATSTLHERRLAVAPNAPVRDEGETEDGVPDPAVRADP